MNSYVRDYVYQNNYKIIPSTMLKLSYCIIINHCLHYKNEFVISTMQIVILVTY